MFLKNAIIHKHKPKYKQGYTETNWSSEKQIDNTSNVNIFPIEISIITQSKCYNLYIEWEKEDKIVSVLICELLTEGQKRSWRTFGSKNALDTLTELAYVRLVYF